MTLQLPTRQASNFGRTSIVPYHGGKTKLVPIIMGVMPAHVSYIEPFCGGASLFWNKPLANLNVLNDKSDRLITFYRVLQERPDEVLRKLDGTLYSRTEWKRARHIWDNSADYSPLEIAWASYVVHALSFGGKGDMFGYAIDGDKTHDIIYESYCKRKARLYRDHKKLQNAIIECDDAITVIKRYDIESAFFYCDPPYINTGQGEYAAYSIADYAELLETLVGIKGKFILSSFLDETNPLLMSAIEKHGWRFMKIKSKGVLAKNIGGTCAEKSEVLVMNFEPQKLQKGLF